MAAYDKNVQVGALTFELNDGPQGISVHVKSNLAQYERGHVVETVTNKYALERLANDILKFIKGEE